MASYSADTIFVMSRRAELIFSRNRESSEEVAAKKERKVVFPGLCDDVNHFMICFIRDESYRNDSIFETCMYFLWIHSGKNAKNVHKTVPLTDWLYTSLSFNELIKELSTVTSAQLSRLISRNKWKIKKIQSNFL